MSRSAWPLTADEGRQLVEDAGDLLLFGGDRLAPRVAELDRHQRLDEQGLAAARGVVDDALDPRPGVRLDRHDVPAVAERHDRFLEGAPELRADERVQPAPQPVVGDPHGRPQATQTRRGGVQQLTHRIEAAGQRGAKGGQRVQVAAQVAQQRPAVVGEDGGQSRGRIERVRDRQEVRRLEPAAADRPLDARPDVVRAADPDVRAAPARRPSAWSVSSSARATTTGLRRRLQGLREAP